MELLRTALLQIAPCGTLEGNLKKGIEYCKEAKKMEAHIALFPGLWRAGPGDFHGHRHYISGKMRSGMP